MDFRTCKIIELAMIIVEDGKIIDKYDEFINIGEPLSPKVISLTGINNQILREKGLDERTVAFDVLDRITDDTLMIAHNCQFDLLFLYALLKRNFPEEADEIISKLKWLDTVTVLKDRKNYPHKLIDAVNHYNIEEVTFHGAVDDTKALYDVAVAMKRERDDLAEYINIFGYNPRYGPGMRLPFIKYKAQPYHNQGMLPQEKILPRMQSYKRVW